MPLRGSSHPPTTCLFSDDLLLCDTSLLFSPRDQDFTVGWHYDYNSPYQENQANQVRFV